jgi:hypothetical protein
MLRIGRGSGGLRGEVGVSWSFILIATIALRGSSDDSSVSLSVAVRGVIASSFFLFFLLWRPIKGGMAPYGFGA